MPDLFTPGVSPLGIPYAADTPKPAASSTTIPMDKYGNLLPDVSPSDVLVEDPVTGDLIDMTTGKVVSPGSHFAPSTSSATSGGGGGSSVPSSTIKGWFEYYYGSAPGNLMQQAEDANWTEQDVINRAIADGKTSVGLNILRDAVRKVAAGFYEGDPTGINAAMVDSLIKDGYWNSDGLAYLQNSYFPQLRGVGATNPLAAGMVDAWTTLTGRSMGSTAMNKMQEIVRTYGFTDVGMNAWEAWIKTTDSAYTGNWGAEHRATIAGQINSILGRGATEAELALKGSMWELNDEALLEALRGTDEYQAIYAGKPAWLTESQYISQAQGYDWVLRSYYGAETILNEDGSLTIPSGPNYAEPALAENFVPTSSAETTPAAWKTLTTETFNTIVANAGIEVVDGKYMQDGTELTVAEVLGALPAGEFYHDTQGFHYVQEAGAVNPKTGTATPAATSTVSTTSTAAAYSGGFNNWGMSYATPEMVNVLLQNNISPDHLAQQFAWTEEADYYQGIYSSMLEETGLGAGIDFYKVASGAKGSGAMRAQLMNAQNTYAFKEAFHSYTGRNPSASDYDYLTKNFVSPNEYAKTMAAFESATSKLPEINDVMERVLGKTLSVTDVQNMVLGKEGSGATQALLSEATKLDAYTWAFKQDQGRNPTPEEYAAFKGYSGPEELVWKITTRERIAENAPVIQQLWRDVYKRELTPEEMQTLFGESAGSGSLKAQWTAAKKAEAQKETDEESARTAGRASTPFSAAAGGGFQLAVKPLPMT